MKWNSKVAAWATVLALVPLIALAAGDETELEERVATLEAQIAVLNEIHGITTTTTVPPSTTTTPAPPTTIGSPTTTIIATTTSVPDATTTLPEPTTTTIPPPEPTDLDAISVIGCSNTFDAVEGYLATSDEDRLKNTAWGGYYLQRWAFRNWPAQYADLRPETGYDAAWLMLCEKLPNVLSVAVTQVVLDKIWAIDPGIPVYISPMHLFPNELCPVTGGNLIPTAGMAIADEMVAGNPLVLRGPDLGPLTVEMLRSNQCHLSESGIAFVGGQLADFFDTD
jgi:hypothetical protein